MRNLDGGGWIFIGGEVTDVVVDGRSSEPLSIALVEDPLYTAVIVTVAAAKEFKVVVVEIGDGVTWFTSVWCPSVDIHCQGLW